MIIYSNKICTPQGLKSGYIEIEHEKIKGIYDRDDFKKKYPVSGKNILNYEASYIIPGFVDNHIHGWGTGSFWRDGTAEAMYRMKRDLVKAGVTSFLGTTGTDSTHRIRNTLKEAKSVMDSEGSSITGAELIGIHLEGPFISKEYSGMQNKNYCISPDLEILKEFIRTAGEGRIKVITIAPELEGSEEVIRYCTEKGIAVQAGHTSSTFEDIRKALEWGVKGVTHTYSGMKGFHHRELGTVGAAMYFGELYAEFAKQTGLTVKHEAFDIMYRIKGNEKILLTTDAVGLSCGNEEFYHYIRKARFVPEGENIKVLYDDGRTEIFNRMAYENIKELELSFLGSVQNLLKQGRYSIEEIVKISSYNPAKYIGMESRKGSLEAGKDADILILDQEYELQCTICRGKLEFDKSSEHND